MSISPSARSVRVADRVSLPSAGAVVHARARLEAAYPVYVTAELESTLDLVAGLAGTGTAAVITDAVVDALYGGPIVRGLRARDVDPLVYAIDAGEPSKSLATATRLWDWLAASDIGRRDTVICIGGGVVADLGGWVASAYMRGLPYVNVPTTLLAQVDGALGGKVAVNHPAAKNLIGAFHQPSGVVTNVGFLASVSPRHISAGLAEAIKKAMIASPAYWAFIEDNVDGILGRDPALLTRLVQSAGAIKTALIERDPYERDLRRPLNFGHTVGHPLETVTGYGPLLHGEAVALGMVVEARIAAERGLLAGPLLDRLVALLRRAALPTTARDLRAPVDAEAVIAAMEKVRLIRAGSLRYVLPAGLGETLIADDVTPEELRAALGACAFSGCGA